MHILRPYICFTYCPPLVRPRGVLLACAGNTLYASISMISSICLGLASLAGIFRTYEARNRNQLCEVGSCPLGREGPLGCHNVRHSSLAMAKQLPLLWVVLWMPQSQRFPLAVC